MSDILNYSRLSLVLKNHLVEHKQKYLYYLAGMFFIGLIVMLLVVSFNRFYGSANVYLLTDKTFKTTEWEGVQTLLYLAGLAVFGIIFSSVSFVNFNNKGEAIFYLIKPASQLEKWLTEIIVHVFLLFAAYTLIFYVIDIPLTLWVQSAEYENFLLEAKNWTALEKQLNHFHSSSVFHFSTLKQDMAIVYPVCISIYVSITAFFLYGAVLFNRFSFFKTLMLGFVTAIVYILYGTWILENLQSLLMPETWRWSSFTRAYSYSRENNYSYEATLPEIWNLILAYFFMAVIPAVLLACSYFKLKEKEV